MRCVVACPKYPAKMIPDEKASMERRAMKMRGAPEKKNSWKTSTFEAAANPAIIDQSGKESR